MKNEKKEIIGSVKEIAGIKWTVLDKTEKGFLCLAEAINEMRFGKNNDWKESSIREHLNGRFYEMLVAAVGTGNIISLERNLLSMDGQTEYGSCEDKVSLITVDEYRKYRALIPNTGYWWWTITPDSTPYNNNSSWIRVVSPGGNIRNGDYYFDYAVRPICIFSSSIFESEEEQWQMTKNCR